MESVLIKVGGWLSALFPAAIGSSLSLFLGAEKVKGLSTFYKLCTFGFGVVLGHQIGGAAIQHWDILPLSPIASTIQIGVGFIGMAALAESKIQLPIWIGAFRKKWLGE